eukprot:96512-Prymnesium_polylepis.3
MNVERRSITRGAQVLRLASPSVGGVSLGGGEGGGDGGNSELLRSDMPAVVENCAKIEIGAEAPSQ